jgi:hypothetical protein
VRNFDDAAMLFLKERLIFPLKRERGSSLILENGHQKVFSALLWWLS